MDIKTMRSSVVDKLRRVNGKPTENKSHSQIPVAKFYTQLSSESLLSPPTSPHDKVGGDKWKIKYDETENKRKTLVSQHQKALRENDDLRKRLSMSETRHRQLSDELNAQRKDFDKLRKLSEDLYKEYDQLRNKYELETGTLNKTVQRATEWYKQNRQLKRKSAVLIEKVLQIAPDTVIDFDEVDQGSEGDEVEMLRKQIEDLNNEVAKLQAELNTAKLQEFEAQEQSVELMAELDDEKRLRTKIQAELEELRAMKENLGNVTRLVANEVTNLREQCEREREESEKNKTAAEAAKRERNILAHQSQILMIEAASDEKLFKALLEIEKLQRDLEEQKCTHEKEIAQLKEKLEEQEVESNVEILEEKLKLVESELAAALQRAERAELQSCEFNQKVLMLEEELEKRNSPPPPPPPPLPLMNMNGTSTLKLKTGKSKGISDLNRHSSANEMASMLGIPKTAQPTVQLDAIEDLISEIKNGKFTLKPREKRVPEKKVEDKPPAVSEMMAVLGTLRRRAGNRTPSFRRTRPQEISNTIQTSDITI